MKKLIITSKYLPEASGIGVYVYNLALHLPSEKTVVIAPKNKEAEKFDKQNRFKTYRKNLGNNFILNFIKFWRVIKKEGIEEIYLNNLIKFNKVVSLLAKLKKIDLTIFLHSPDLNLLLQNPKKIKKYIKTLQNSKQIICDSLFLKNRILDVLNLDENKIKVLHPCPGDFFLDNVDEEIIKKLKTKLALNGKKVVLTIARLDEGKGYPLLIRLMPQILKSVPNLAWVIIGDGPKKEELISFIQKNNLQNVVRYLGNIDYFELPKYYQLADVFALLTHKDKEAQEGWATAFLEAQASGLPIIAGQVDAINEMVENLKTAIVVDSYQDMSVISAVTNLLKEEDYALEMGKRGRERILSNFKWKENIKILFPSFTRRGEGEV